MTTTMQVLEQIRQILGTRLVSLEEVIAWRNLAPSADASEILRLRSAFPNYAPHLNANDISTGWWTVWTGERWAICPTREWALIVGQISEEPLPTTFVQTNRYLRYHPELKGFIMGGHFYATPIDLFGEDAEELYAVVTSEIVNLTPHEINIHVNEGRIYSVPASGQVARRNTSQEEFPCSVVGVPAVRTVYGEVAGLPEPQFGKVYAVSALVAQAVPERMDVFCPGEAVRDSQGKIIGCKGLSHV